MTEEKEMISFQWDKELIELLNQFVAIVDDHSRSEFIREAIWEKLVRELQETDRYLTEKNIKRAVQEAAARGAPRPALTDLRGWTIDPEDPGAVEAEKRFMWYLDMLNRLERTREDHAAAASEIEQLLKDVK